MITYWALEQKTFKDVKQILPKLNQNSGETKSYLGSDFQYQSTDRNEIAEDEVLRDFATFLIWPKDQDKAENRTDVATEVCNFSINYTVLTATFLNYLFWN